MTPCELIRIAGGVTKVARALSLSHSTVLGWQQIPLAHVPAISRTFGVSRHDLRPDYWEQDRVVEAVGSDCG